MAKQILKYILSFFLILFSFLSWYFERQAVNASNSGAWLFPIIWFSLLFITLYLSIVIIKEKHFLVFLLLISFLSSFIFAIHFWHLLFILIAILFALIGIFKIRRDLDLNIKINLGKTLGTGKQLLLLGIAITVASQYYVEIKNKETLDIVPRVENMTYTNIIISKVLSSVNPNFKNISEENLTVDEFILKTQENQTKEENNSSVNDEQIDKIINNELGDSATSEQKQEVRDNTLKKLQNISNQAMTDNQELILTESRKKMSEMAGKNLTGQEKMSDVFSEMINKKISDFVRVKNTDNKSMPVIPMVMAILLFLSVYSLGSFLSIFWIYLTQFIFWIFVKSKIVKISKIQREVEIIE